MTRSNIIDLTVVHHHNTDRAVLVSSDEASKPEWLPLSQVEVHVDLEAVTRGQQIEISLPEPVAVEKGLV